MLGLFLAMVAAGLTVLEVAGIINIGLFWAIFPILIPVFVIIAVFLFGAGAAGVFSIADTLSNKRRAKRSKRSDWK